MTSGLPDYGLSDGALLWLESSLQSLYGATSIPDALATLCIVPGVQSQSSMLTASIPTRVVRPKGQASW